MSRQPYVYIVTDRRHGTLYVGVTSNLPRRVFEHRSGLIEGFSKRYGLKTLIWYETLSDMESAIVREKQIKSWRRSWKIDLIERMIPTWRDLHDELNN